MITAVAAACAGSTEEVFQCRKVAAQQRAREMCAQLKDSPPTPPFRRVQLLTGAADAEPERARQLPGSTVAAFVEARRDFVSDQLAVLGASPAHSLSCLFQHCCPRRKGLA